ncbi:MAG: hypothetical protein ACM359_06080 [Bacillota bacterium]
MSSRDVWSHGSGTALHDLLSSSLLSLLLAPPVPEPAYFCSPWLSNFVLFGNCHREVSAAFPTLADAGEIWFSEYLAELAQRMPVRVVTVRNEITDAFLAGSAMRESDVQVRFAGSEFHEKGVLTPRFYIEGSMNLTYSGVYIRGEKVTFHTPDDVAGRRKIAATMLEFGRQWANLDGGRR